MTFRDLFKPSSAAFLGGLLVAALPQVHAQDLYWTTNGPVIMGADRDGTNVTEIFDGTGAAGSAVDVAVTDTHIYWTDKIDTTAGGVWRANRDGSNPTLFISNPGASTWAPQFIAIDEANDKLYFSDWYLGLFQADLSTGGNVVSLGSPSGGAGTTGLILRGSNEIISVNGDENSNLIFSTAIDTQTHTVLGWYSGAGGHYGLAYDSSLDKLYYAGFANGVLYSYSFATATLEEVLTGLGQPLGVALSDSQSHLLIVERTSGEIVAHDLANPSGSFPVVAGGGFFGLGLQGDPALAPPTPPAVLPIVDTFEGGTPGNSIADQSTSDGMSVWRVTALAETGTINYAGEAGAVTYEPFIPDGRADIYLDTNVDGNRNYNIKFDDVLLRGGKGDADGVLALDTFLGIGARKTDDSDRGTYQIRQWFGMVDGDYEFRYGIHYIDLDGNAQIAPGNWIAQKVPLAEVEAGDYSGSELLRSGLEIQVRGSTQRLFLNGAALGPSYPTQGSFDDRLADRALVIQTGSGSHADTFANPVIHGVTVEAAPEPPPAIAGWQKIDDFEDRSPGTIHEQGAWSVPNAFAEVIENPYGAGNVLRVVNGRASHLILIPEGETGTVFFRARPFGNDDFSFVTTRSDVLGGTGTSAGQFAFRASGKLDIVDNSASPNHIKTVGEYEPHTWYDVWIVVDNGAKTAKYYVRGGEFTERTLMEDALGQTEFNHRSTAAGDILAFGFQAFARAPMLVDEIWINAIEEDLTDPSPVPQDTEPALNPGPLLAYEGFNYAPSPLLHLDGGKGWIYGHFVVGNNVAPEVVSPGFDWTGLGVAGNRVVAASTTEAISISYRFIDTNAIDPALVDSVGQIGNVGGPVYASFLMESIPPIGSGAIGFALFRSNQERVFVGKGSNETTEQGWKLHGGGTANQYTGIPYEGRSLFVLRVEGAVTHLFHNPDLGAGEPNVSEAVATITATDSIGNYGFNNIRLLGRGAGMAFDEIRVGTSWASVTPAEVTATGFTAWQDDHFGPGADPAISGAEADPDGDGLKNILEYALGLDPLVAGTGGVPSHGTMDVGGEAYLTVSFNRPIGIADVAYDVGASDDLIGWGSAVLVGTTDNGDGTEQVVYRHPSPMAGSFRGFLRLEVAFN